MPRRWKVLAAAAMVTCFTSGYLLQRQLAPNGDVYQEARLFETVLAHVRDYHVDSIGETDLYRKATDGLLGRPGDPEDWTRTLAEAAAVCRDPARKRAALDAQEAYLEAGRKDIPERLLAFWRDLAAADGDAAAADGEAAAADGEAGNP